MIKICCALLMGMALLCINVHAQETLIEVSGVAYIVIDTNSGKVLYEKNATEAYPVAGIARYLSVYASLQKSETETVFHDQGHTYSNAIGLQNEATYNVDDLRYSVIFANKEDAGDALAMMFENPLESLQQQAKDIGMVSTSFSDTYSNSSSSSALDIALLARSFAKSGVGVTYYGATKYMPVSFGNASEINREVLQYEGFVGEFDAASDEAKTMSVATVQKDATSFTAVVIGETSKDIAQKDLTLLFNTAFANYQTITITASSLSAQIIDIAYKGSDYQTTFTLSKDLNLLMPKSIDPDTIQTSYAYENETDPSSIKGYLVISQGDKEVGRVEMQKEQKVLRVSSRSKLNLFDYFAMGLAIVFTAVFILKYVTLMIRPKE